MGQHCAVCRYVCILCQIARTVSPAAAAVWAACAGAYAFGASDTNSCPPASSKIDTEAACESAAAAVGLTYGGSETLPFSPTGCFLNVAAHRIIFNRHPAGAPGAFTQPLCAGVRRPALQRTHSAHALRARVGVGVYIVCVVLYGAVPTHACNQTAHGRTALRVFCGMQPQRPPRPHTARVVPRPPAHRR
jgi:hypothetical protein